MLWTNNWAIPSEIQKPKGIPINDDLIKGTQGRTQMTSDQKDSYPDLFFTSCRKS